MPLGVRLPHGLQAALPAGSPTCQPFGADEFVRRVAERVGSSRRRLDAVRGLGTLEREVAEMEAVRQWLPPEFAALMA
jgi:hypothetical protein